jgi:hypothetical protein
MKSQEAGHNFNSNEIQRLSDECRSFFDNIFVNERNRKEIRELKKTKWIVNMSLKIQVPFFII